jgi:hypothetical protein
VTLHASNKVRVLQLPTSGNDELSSASKAGLIAGVTVGAVVVVAIAAAVAFLVVKSRSSAPGPASTARFDDVEAASPPAASASAASPSAASAPASSPPGASASAAAPSATSASRLEAIWCGHIFARGVSLLLNLPGLFSQERFLLTRITSLNKQTAC